MMMMESTVCANCGLSLETNSNLDNQIHENIHIDSFENSISVHTALSTIYKLQYLTPVPFPGDEKVNEEDSMVVCRCCADLLARLYKLYAAFNHLRTIDSVLSSKILELDNLIVQQQLLRFPVIQDWSQTTSHDATNHNQQQQDDMPIVNDDCMDPPFEDFDNFSERLISPQPPPPPPPQQQQFNEAELPQSNRPSLEDATSRHQEKHMVVVKLENDSLHIPLPPGPWVKLVRLRPEEIPISPGQAAVQDKPVTPKSNSLENITPTNKPVLTDHLTKNFGEHYSCPACSKECGNKNDFHRHIHFDHKTDPLPCPHCQKPYTGLTTLLNHLRSTTHLPRTFVCQHCSKAFGRIHDLRKHLVVYRGVRTHLCQLCGRTFGDNQGLKRHLQRHSMEKPFVCHRGFHVRGNLKDHEKIHSEVKLYLCPTYGKSFAQPQGLSTHIRWHRNVMEVETKD